MTTGDAALPARRSRLSGRWLATLIAFAALLALAFYSVTDPLRLANSTLLDGADYAGYAVCHRITLRSFSIAGRQFPLCARCTGMFLGVMVAFVSLLLARRGRWSELPPARIMIVFIGLMALMGVDGVNSYSHFFPELPHLYEPRNWLRLVTGMGAGLTMGAILFPALAQTIWWEAVPRPSVGSFTELAGFLLLGGLTVLLVLSNQPIISYVLALVSAVGVVVILTSICTMLLLIVSRRDARAQRWRHALPPVLLGLVMAISLITIISVLRFSLTGTMTGLPGL
jgi:uncharacterized membrane protein